MPKKSDKFDAMANEPLSRRDYIGCGCLIIILMVIGYVIWLIYRRIF